MINVLIYGLGHIGGSLALSIRKNLSKSHKVSGIDINKATIKRIKEKSCLKQQKQRAKKHL